MKKFLKNSKKGVDKSGREEYIKQAVAQTAVTLPKKSSKKMKISLDKVKRMCYSKSPLADWLVGMHLAN